MGKIVETPETFFDIVIIFLYDMMVNIDMSVLKRDDIISLIDTMEKKGLKSKFMKHYMENNKGIRVDYKRIKEVFYNPKSDDNTIKLISNNNINESEINNNFYKIKDQIRQVIHIMKKQKYKTPYKVITDMELDKIINYVLTGDKK